MMTKHSAAGEKLLMAPGCLALLLRLAPTVGMSTVFSPPTPPTTNCTARLGIDATTLKESERTMQMELSEFNWGDGLAAYGLLAPWGVTGDERHFDFVKDWLDRTVHQVPEDRYVGLTRARHC